MEKSGLIICSDVFRAIDCEYLKSSQKQDGSKDANATIVASFAFYLAVFQIDALGVAFILTLREW